ncbi:MAG: formyltetrahydrofolate deformylase [Ilumatobacteraceae bacterium]
MPEPATTVTLLLSCPDQPGIVAATADFVYRHGGNIVHADQHIDEETGVFFQRIEVDLDRFGLARDEIEPALAEVEARFGMDVHVRFSDERPRVAVLVSREAHCMYDLLARWRGGELDSDIALVASNHPDHVDAAEHFGVPYVHLPVTPSTKAEQERQLVELLEAHAIDLVVLARYMQILSPAFVARYPQRIINIHHSFLPAFIGSRPYHQAHERGVKLVGVTAHYVTDELDEGPIIDQDVERVSHRDAVRDLIRKGRDLEKSVLARAVRAHLEHRILVYGNKTVVFD